MWCRFSKPGEIIILGLLITTSYALPSYWKSSPLTSAAERSDISSLNFSGNLDVGGKGIPPYSHPLENHNISTEPEWPIICDEHDVGLNVADCLQIATTIERSPGAQSFRVYRSDTDFDRWTQGGCLAQIDSIFIESTDVFKPVSIARAIRRVVEMCAGGNLRHGGTTAVGPRQKFFVSVEKRVATV